MEERITTLWNKPYKIERANYKWHASYTYAKTWSKVAAREAMEENGYEDDEEENDEISDLGKRTRKGRCCTGMVFTALLIARSW